MASPRPGTFGTATQTPQAPAEGERYVDAGVIEDARQRQRRHRRIGGILLAAAAAALIAGFGGGGGSPHRTGPNASGSAGGPAYAGSTHAYPGAPTTQRNGYGVATRACPLAKPNRYLPARSGCVTVRYADIGGDGHPDLVIVYSLLSHRHPYWYAGPVPAEIRNDFVAERAYLKVVLPNGSAVATPITEPRNTWAAAMDFIAHVNNDPGGEIFLEVARTSSGAAGVAYGMREDRLVAAGPPLAYGGDSAYKAGWDCIQGRTPGVTQRTFDLIGPTIYGFWKETEVTYSWDGPRLVRSNQLTFKEHGLPARSEIGAGTGC